jgi:peptidoglycan/xylan/chitin deacetylase (PgdA/CDA1 family)
MNILMQRFLGLCFVCLISALSCAQQRSVALTFDDLPLALAGSSGKSTPNQILSEARAANTAILHALRLHHAPAIAFVNEKQVIRDGHIKQNRAILREWAKQGHELGNHTYSHADLSKVTVESFEKEIIDGEPSVRLLMSGVGRPLRYLRFPFNHTGETAEKHDAIAAFLRGRGYEVATCTVENSDWVFAHAYRLMMDRHDAQSVARLRTDYLEYTRQEIEYYSKLNRQIFGHDIPQVMLLHANGLNAEMLDQVLKIFEELDYKFVSLREAQADSAYRTPDTFFTPFGLMWGYRWARELNVKVDGRSEPEVPAWIENYK